MKEAKVVKVANNWLPIFATLALSVFGFITTQPWWDRQGGIGENRCSIVLLLPADESERRETSSDQERKPISRKNTLRTDGWWLDDCAAGGRN